MNHRLRVRTKVYLSCPSDNNKELKNITRPTTRDIYLAPLYRPKILEPLYRHVPWKSEEGVLLTVVHTIVHMLLVAYVGGRIQVFWYPLSSVQQT